MKIGCKIIQDILPLYAENLASNETNLLVEKHLVDCEDCRDLLNGMKEPSDIPVALSEAPLVHLKKKLFKKRLATVFITAIIVLAIAISGFIYLTTPHYLPLYYAGARTIAGEITYGGMVVMFMEEEPFYSSEVTLCFSEDVTGFYVESYWNEDETTKIYRITAWYTILDRITGRNNRHQYLINIPSGDDGKFVRIYYSPNDGTEDIFIYGSVSSSSGGVITLPRLVLGYYLIFAVIASVMMAILLFVIRKKRAVRLCIEKILLFPVSYIISHLCVMFIKGHLVITYSAQRDFLCILFITIAIYLACLLGISKFRARKEGQKNL